MSNKHYVKRMRRLAQRAGLHSRGQLTSIRQLYDVARSAEQSKRAEHTRQVNLAYAQHRAQANGAGPDILAKLEAADKKRSAQSRRRGK